NLGIIARVLMGRPLAMGVEQLIKIKGLRRLHTPERGAIDCATGISFRNMDSCINRRQDRNYCIVRSERCDEPANHIMRQKGPGSVMDQDIFCTASGLDRG